jgi:hypothetical protein
MHVHHLEKHNPSMPNNAITKQDKDANTPLSKANPSMHPSSTIAEEREEKQTPPLPKQRNRRQTLPLFAQLQKDPKCALP